MVLKIGKLFNQLTEIRLKFGQLVKKFTDFQNHVYFVLFVIFEIDL